MPRFAVEQELDPTAETKTFRYGWTRNGSYGKTRSRFNCNLRATGLPAPSGTPAGRCSFGCPRPRLRGRAYARLFPRRAAPTRDQTCIRMISSYAWTILLRTTIIV